jgi:glycosyltransferase involved in cell wall biosynthesis
MKILQVSSLYPPDTQGGAEVSISSLARFLAARGDDVTVLTLTPGRRLRYARIDGVKVLRIPLWNFYWPFGRRVRNPLLKAGWHLLDRFNLPMFLVVRRILRRLRPDLAHTHNLAGFSPLVWLAARREGIPVVHTFHDFYALCLKTTRFGRGECGRPCLACRLGSLSARWACPSVDAFTGVSEYIGEAHRQAGLVPPGVRLEAIVNAIDAGPCQHRAGFREGGRDLCLGYLGRLEPEKGIGWLVRALGRRSGVPGWRLLVGGRFSDPGYERTLLGEAAGEIAFLGQVDARDFYQSVDLLVVPSLWNEPFGRVVIEAMAHGVPVLGAARGGIREIISHGRDGFLFEPDDVPAFLALFDALLTGTIPLDPLREQALATAAGYAEAAVYPRYRRLFASLTGR